MAKIKVYILEGLPGAGKDTLQRKLIKRFKSKNVYAFSEEDLLSSWKHALIPRVEDLLVDYFDLVLSYIESVLKQDTKAVFILNRFHVSLLITASKLSPKTKKKYDKLLTKLEKLPVCILVPFLKKEEIEKRAVHPERKERAWKKHLQDWLNQKGFRTAKEAFEWEQQKILKILQTQKIPYRLVRIKR